MSLVRDRGSAVTPPRADPSGSDGDLPVAALRLDHRLRARSINPAWRRLAAAAGVDPAAAWWTLVAQADHPHLQEWLDRALSTRTAPPPLDVESAVPSVWLELHVAVTNGDVHAGLVVVALDVSASRRREEQLVHDSTHDPLTGVHNRSAVLDRIHHALTRLERQDGLLAVLYVDLDDFKLVNDVNGHHVGDEVLRATAARLAGAIRPMDTLARIGGDEFVVLCESLTSRAEAATVAKRLQASLEEPLDTTIGRFAVQVTIGVAFADDAADTAASLIDRADRAMYALKAAASHADP